MIFRDVIVDIPSKKRVRRSTNYVYEILHRKGKEYEKDVVALVGIAISDKQMNPNEKYFELHNDVLDLCPQNVPTDFSHTLQIGAYLLIKKVCENEGLLNILKSVFDVKANEIFAYLVYNLVEQNSVAQTLKYFMFNNYAGLNYVPSDATLSKLFNEIIDDSSIKKFMTEWMKYRMKKMSKDDVVDVDFDSTNFNVSSKNVTLKENGKPKIDESLPQVNVAYFLDRKTGIPFYYDIYYGSINDMEHCQTAINKLKEIKDDLKISFIMDRGYFSQKNIEYIANHNYFFMCLGKSNKKFKDYIKEYPKEKIRISRNRVTECIYGIKLYGKAFDNSKFNYNIYLFYNEYSGIHEINSLQSEIEKVCTYLVGKSDENGQIRNTYDKRIILKLNEENVIISATPNYDFIDEYNSSLGYFWIVSNEDLSLLEAYESYKKRDVIEKSFMMSKSSSDFLKKYSQTDEAYCAKTFIGFLSGVIRSSILNTFDTFLFQNTSETSQTIILEANKITCEKLSKNYIPRYALTNKQKQLLSFIKINQQNVNSLIEEINATLNR